MINRKIKGINAERYLLRKFFQNGWACIRASASGSQKDVGLDLIAGNKLRKLGIEVKVVNSDKLYIPKPRMQEFLNFCDIFGLEPWIAVKFKSTEFYFINPEDMKVKSSSYAITLEQAKNFGLLFEELIESYVTNIQK